MFLVKFSCGCVMNPNGLMGLGKLELDGEGLAWIITAFEARTAGPVVTDYIRSIRIQK